jgi:UDP-glucose 4-epimerase
MKVLVTGGAGFFGRWISKKFLDQGAEVHIYDNLSNGSEENISEFRDEINFVKADIRNRSALECTFRNKFDICIHAAAQINVQKSIDNPDENFEVNVVGSENVLRECHKTSCKMVHISSCMVYDISGTGKGISENHAILPKSPYAASKLAADHNALGYHYAYGDSTLILRPFNTYGPFQRTDTEGGVVSIFVKQSIHGQPLTIFKPGSQTRDLLYVEDCAEFVYRASVSRKCNGIILNAGYDKDIKIIDLARSVTNNDESKIKFVKHPHPQSEIMKLLCDSRKARTLLHWEPKTDIRKGIYKLTEWMAEK